MPSSTRTTIDRAARIMSTARSTSASGTSACATHASIGVRASTARTSSQPTVRPGEELARLAAALEDDRQHRGQQEGVRAGAKRQVEIGDVRDLRAPRVDHDHAAAGRPSDLVHLVPRPLEAVRHPGIAPEHHEQVGVLDVLRRVAELVAEEPPVHPEVAGLLLRERVEVLVRAERARERQEAKCRRGGCPARRRRRTRTPRRRARRGSRSGGRRSR